MYKGFYNQKRFLYLDKNIKNNKNFSIIHKDLIPKTACFFSDKLNFFIDTSDGVNEDLKIPEYCGRLIKIIEVCKGKRFILFKSAYSPQKTNILKKMAEKNNGSIIPFFKWSFNENFYKNVFPNKKDISDINKKTKKKYDIGIFFNDKQYVYPKPSSYNSNISWKDHKKFNIEGKSCNTGYYKINSRKNILKKLKNSNYKIYHGSLSYNDYIKKSFECKITINPPGIGEYTSRMFDQTFLGKCIVMRRNSYDNALTWKKHIPEIDFYKPDWKSNLDEIIYNYDYYDKMSLEYFNEYWTSKIITDYLFRGVFNERNF